MNMKKTLSLLLVLTLVMAVFVGCSGNDDEEVDTEEPAAPVEENNDEEDAEDEEVTGEGDVAKLGLGKVVALNGTEAEGEDPASGQVDVTMAAVGFDDEGKIVSVTIDTVQGKVGFNEELELETDVEEEVLTKKELEYDYDMKDVSEIDKEWFEQMEAFEEWMIGKTAEEVVNIEVKERDENHQHVPDVEELTSTVTITVENYIAAVEDAWENAIEVDGAESVGLGVSPSVARSAGLDGDNPAKIQHDVTMGAFAFDGEGEVVGSILDVVQGEIEFDEDGKLITDLDEEVLSKKELEDDYGMVKASEIEKEWYEQAEAFEEWMKGKSIEEITGLEVVEKDENHTHVPDVEELTSSVTMDVEDFLIVAEKAFENKN